MPDSPALGHAPWRLSFAILGMDPSRVLLTVSLPGSRKISPVSGSGAEASGSSPAPRLGDRGPSGLRGSHLGNFRGGFAAVSPGSSGHLAMAEKPLLASRARHGRRSSGSASAGLPVLPGILESRTPPPTRFRRQAGCAVRFVGGRTLVSPPASVNLGPCGSAEFGAFGSRERPVLCLLLTLGPRLLDGPLARSPLP